MTAVDQCTWAPTLALLLILAATIATTMWLGWRDTRRHATNRCRTCGGVTRHWHTCETRP